MRRSGLGRLLLLAALASCARPPAAVPPGAPALCRADPNGAPPPGSLADTVARGFADKGIGGTGGPATAITDNGIGGTGIVAVITGFASVCLGGQEVALDADTQVVVGGQPTSPSALRVGEVATVVASGPAGALRARQVTVGFVVAGPVEAASPGSLIVAGQGVRTDLGTAGVRPVAGDWVAVSGLRQPDGALLATRIEASIPGPVTVTGTLRRGEGGAGYAIGNLPLVADPALAASLGRSVVVSGPLLGPQLQPFSVAPDLLGTDPAALFGPAVSTVLIERARPSGPGEPAIRSISRFERGARGLEPQRTDAPRPQFVPAPMPNRGMDRGSGAGRGEGAGERGPGLRRNGPGGEGPGDGAGPGRRGPGR